MDNPENIPSDDSYAFFGRIHPERATVRIDETIVEHHSQFGTIEMEIFSHGSQVLVEAYPEQEEELADLATLRNTVKSGVSSLTNPVSFLLGKHITVEIVATITPSGHKTVFGVEYPYIAEKTEREAVYEEWFPKISYAFQTGVGPYLQRAFTDYRLAMEHPEDTGFYCFRAVESLRQYFYDGDDRHSWERLRDATNVDRQTIEDNIQDYSRERRHGDVYYITGEERQSVLETTWDILGEFLNYTNNNVDPVERPINEQEST